MAVDSINLIPVLEYTLNGDQSQLRHAQQYLEQVCSADAGSFLLLLSNVLRTTTNDPAVRTAAGIQLKNFLAARDIAVQNEKFAAWKLIDQQKRSQIKENVFETLGTEHASAHAAPSIIATIAGVEIRAGKWSELIPSLCNAATDANSTQELRQACLESISYICEDVDGTLLLPFANGILTAIIFGITPQHASRVRLAATRALMHAVDFCKGNFDITHERDYLMEQVRVATQPVDASCLIDNTHNVQVCVAAWQCVSRIITLYYQHMEEYMKELCAKSRSAMESKEPEIAMQGIEFWSTVAEEERDLKNIEREDALDGRAPAEKNYHFVNAEIQFVCPLLLKALKQQSDEEDNDEWTVAKAATVCLRFLAQAAGDDVVDYVHQFADKNIEDPDWRCRDAAVTAIGSILEGPDAVRLREFVVQALPCILRRMQDSKVIVRDSASWTMARVCDNVKEAVLNDDKFGDVRDALYKNVTHPSPKVAAHSCCTLASLVEASYNYAVETMPPPAAASAQCINGTAAAAAETTCETGSPQNPDMSNADRDLVNIPSTYAFSSEFEFVKLLLLQTARRPDVHQANLRAAVYEALSEIVEHSARDCAPTVNNICEDLLNLSMQQIAQAAAAAAGSSNELTQCGDLLQLILPVINVCLRRLPALPDRVLLCESCVTVTFQLLDMARISSAGGGPSLNCGPEAFMILSTLVMKLQNSFRHLSTLGDHVVWAIGGGGNAEGNNSEHTLSGAACALLSDICKSSLGPTIRSAVSSLGLVERLVDVIKRAGQDASGLTRINAISCIGDIAMLLNIDFGPHIAVTFDTLGTCLQEAFGSPVYPDNVAAAAVAGAGGAPSFSSKDSVANNINANAAAEGSGDGNSMHDWSDQRSDLLDSVFECFDTVIDSLRYAGDHREQQQPNVADQQVHAQAADLLRPYAECILAAIYKCCSDGKFVHEATVRHSAGLIASLTLIFGVDFLAYYPQMDFLFALLNRGKKMRSYSAATKSACSLAAKQIKRAKTIAASARSTVMPEQLSFAGNNAAMPGTQPDAPSQMGNKQPLMLNDNNDELLQQHSQAQQQNQFGGVALQALNYPWLL